MAIEKIKISELPLADTLVGLYTIGVNDMNKSVKVSMDDVIKSSLKFTPQTLTPAQQQQARDNIGAQQQPVGSALTPLFVARGAVYNATTGYYELNGLTDITEVQMIAIYNYTSQSPNGNNWNSVFWYTMGVRTNFGLKAIVGQVNDMYGAFSQSSFEVINLECLSYKSRPTKVKDLTSTFDLCLKLKKIIGVIDVSAITTSILTGLYRAPLLEDVLILRLNVSISFEQSVNLSKKTLQYLITEATNTTPITVTVNSAVYAKLTDPTNAEWYAINTMAVAKNIAFAK